MATIVKVKDQAVTLGVLDSTMDVHPHLRQVTFKDHNGTAHTVHTHVDGPFQSPEDIVSAWESGDLHPFDSHEAAAVDAEDHDHKALAAHYRDLAGTGQGHNQQGQGSGY